jgi:hypothetical protein
MSELEKYNLSYEGLQKRLLDPQEKLTDYELQKLNTYNINRMTRIAVYTFNIMIVLPIVIGCAYYLVNLLNN